MSSCIVVTGADTGIGKTVFSAGLAGLVGANCSKPVQAGLDGETDAEIVARLGSLSPDRIVPEHYLPRTPVSLHQSAEIDGVRIGPTLHLRSDNHISSSTTGRRSLPKTFGEGTCAEHIVDTFTSHRGFRWTQLARAPNPGR